MSSIAIRQATKDDAPRLNEALKALSIEIGDVHATTDRDLVEGGFEAAPAFEALLADRNGDLAGVIMFSPVYSTIRGSAGVYVSDLWVTPKERGKGVGKRLLHSAMKAGKRKWKANFVKLAVYGNNAEARAFYHRLGFTPSEEHVLVLDGPAFNTRENQR